MDPVDLEKKVEEAKEKVKCVCVCVQKLTFFNSWCLQNGVYIIIIIMST